MGHFMYGGQSFEFEDRVLAHIKTAIEVRLRKHESFLLSWNVAPQFGSGRVSLWMAPTMPLIFMFSGSRPPVLNRDWIAVMTEHAHTVRGMIIVSEAEAMAYSRSRK